MCSLLTQMKGSLWKWCSTSENNEATSIVVGGPMCRLVERLLSASTQELVVGLCSRRSGGCLGVEGMVRRQNVGRREWLPMLLMCASIFTYFALLFSSLFCISKIMAYTVTEETHLGAFSKVMEQMFPYSEETCSLPLMQCAFQWHCWIRGRGVYRTGFKRSNNLTPFKVIPFLSKIAHTLSSYKTIYIITAQITIHNTLYMIIDSPIWHD